MSFTPTGQQKAIIERTEGPVLVIAGPGSGKTFTLVERIVYLLAVKKVQPETILVATFTEKAASELITRISHRLASRNLVVDIDAMYVGTFHSICLRLLEEYRDFSRLKSNFTLMDQFDQQYFFLQRMRDFEKEAPLSLLLGHDKLPYWTRAKTLCTWMNKLAEEVVDAEKLMQSTDEVVQALGKWYALYQQLLADENRLDFSSIQLDTLKMLENNKDAVLEPLREKLRYLMIDEYQDTNTIQERLLFTLLNEQQNICVVGDDDQGLYRFRGATIRNILEFPKKFPDGQCKQYSLVTNYRSDPAIIDFYNKWIVETNKDFSWDDKNGTEFRYAKDIAPPEGRASFPQSVVKVSGSATAQNWHQEVLEFLLQLKEQERIEDWNQVAFLFRSVKSGKAQALAQFLEENNIPVYSPRSELFFDRPEVRLVVGALMFMFPTCNEVLEGMDALEKKPDVLGFYQASLGEFGQALRSPENKELLNWCRHRTNEIYGMTERKPTLDYAFSSLFYQLLQFPLFAQFLELRDSSRDERPAQNLARFSELLVKFEYLHNIQVFQLKYLETNVRKFFKDFFRHVFDGGITEFEDPEEVTPKGAVSFMTIHQAKGLEFPVTVVGSLDVSPRKQHTDLDEVLQAYYGREPFEPLGQMKFFDFKRLYYTAFSRAKNLLVLTCQEKDTKTGKVSHPTALFRSLYATVPSWRDVDFSSVEIDTVHPSDFKGRYSYTSHVLVYEGCPRQYQFFKHWDFTPSRIGSTIFGQLVHQTIEDIHKAVLRGNPEAVDSQNIEQWLHSNYANLSKKERVYLRQSHIEIALKQVLRYVERKNGAWDNIRGTEVDVSLVKENYILIGKIDLIQGQGDTVEIVDFKSTPKPDQCKERYVIDRYKRQLEIYAHIVEQRHGVKVSALNLYYTGEESGSPIHSFPYEAPSVDHTITEIDSVVARMQNKDFDVPVEQRTAKRCNECDFKAYCDRI